MSQTQAHLYLKSKTVNIILQRVITIVIKLGMTKNYSVNFLPQKLKDKN